MRGQTWGQREREGPHARPTRTDGGQSPVTRPRGQRGSADSNVNAFEPSGTQSRTSLTNSLRTRALDMARFTFNTASRTFSPMVIFPNGPE